VSSTISEVGIYKDFEIIWLDKWTRQPKDMNNVTVEIYHYEEAKPGEITVPNPEPYIFDEGINDTVNIGSLCPTSGYIVDEHFTIQLNLIVTQLDGLGCPPNDYVVCETNNKVAIVNGRKKYALSACELAALINLNASGYTASAENGFLVLTGDLSGSDCYLKVGNGTFNQVVGLVEGDEYYGSYIALVHDMTAQNMTRISTGRYAYTNVHLEVPPYVVGERYFALYRGVEPVTDNPEIHEEDFTLVSRIGSPNTGIIYSFI